MKALLLAPLALLASVSLGCSSEEADPPGNAGGSSSGGHGSEFPSCAAISEACHPLDDGNPSPAHTCHELAHDAASEAACAAEKDACLATCVADAGSDGGHDHDHEH